MEATWNDEDRQNYNNRLFAAWTLLSILSSFLWNTVSVAFVGFLENRATRQLQSRPRRYIDTNYGRSS